MTERLKIIKSIYDTYYPLSYPDGIVYNPVNVLSLDSKQVNFCKNGKHNAVQVAVKVKQYMQEGVIQMISIPQAGSFITHFRLRKSADRVTLIVNGIEIYTIHDLVAGVWYNIFTCPINSYTIPYGQRFLEIRYNGDIVDVPKHMEILYLDPDDETNRHIVDLARFD